MWGFDTSSLFGVRGDPVDIGEDELDNDEGGVSGVLEPAHETDDGDDVLDVDVDEDSHWEDWGFEGDLPNPGTGDVVEFGSGTGVLELEAAALAALRETISLG